MTKTCPKCKTDNPDSSGFCQSCGTDLKTSKTASKTDKKSDKNLTAFWNKQGKGGKAAIGISICCLGLLLIIGVTAMMSSDKTSSSNTTSNVTSTPSTDNSTSVANNTPAVNTPETVTISQLYGNSIPVGTVVKVTGTVIESDGSRLRIKNSDGKDIMVEGSNLDAYEDQTVTVTGSFYGPSTYDTAMGVQEPYHLLKMVR